MGAFVRGAGLKGTYVRGALVLGADVRGKMSHVHRASIARRGGKTPNTPTRTLFLPCRYQ